ncbi:MAG: PTS sugar transporter subunit IIC [Clostridia bacterium]|nr:PTS sugar transporter subunit IIC [Clostridia bacterium]
MTKTKKNGKFINYLKALPKRYFIDAFTGMAQGLFVTLIAGTIIKTIGEKIGATTAVGQILILLGQIASILTGAGIGVGMANYLKAPKLVVFSAIVAGFIGAYAEKVIGATITFNSISVGLNSDITSITALFTPDQVSPGNPISAYVCALIAIELGTLVQGKTKLDILLVPLTCVVSAFVGCFISIPFIWLIKVLSKGIDVATGAVPFVMGIVISVVMGILLTMPTSSAAIWVSIATGVTTQNMYLAGGAAVVGCACHMVGFAVASFKDNGFSGLISQGLGTSMLQIPNIMKKPIIMLPMIISSAILGPLSTCVFKLLCNASGGGMGTSGLVGVFGVLAVEGQDPLMMWLGIILLMFVLPALLNLGITAFMRKKGWIKPGDMKLD